MSVRYRAMLRWCATHRQSIASTATAREPYCRRGIHLREGCEAVYARIEWAEGDDTAEPIDARDLGELST